MGMTEIRRVKYNAVVRCQCDQNTMYVFAFILQPTRGVTLFQTRYMFIWPTLDSSNMPVSHSAGTCLFCFRLFVVFVSPSINGRDRCLIRHRLVRFICAQQRYHISCRAAYTQYLFGNHNQKFVPRWLYGTSEWLKIVKSSCRLNANVWQLQVIAVE